MSKLEELLQGSIVELKYLEDIAKIFSGGTPKTSKSEFYDGDIPWIRSGEVNFNVITSSARNITKEGLIGSSAKLIRKNSVVLAMTGATVGRSAVIEFETSSNQSVAAIETDENFINYKYLYYFLENNYLKLKNSGQGALTSLNLAMIKKIQIPIPPIEIQQEIVRVLDELISLTNQLTTELETERQNRKKQFEYFREQLFTFEEGKAEWKSLKDVAEYSKKRINFTFLNESNYVGVDNLLQNRGGKINSKHIPTEGNSTAFLTNNILIGNIRPYLKKIWLADCDGGSNGDVLVINIIDKIIHHKYLYHILSNDEFFKYNMQHAKGAKMPRGNKQKIMEYIFPIPSLAEQERIVKLLDQLNTTHTAIEEEITKEIKLRTQQYEYYREKLLTFPEN